MPTRAKYLNNHIINMKRQSALFPLRLIKLMHFFYVNMWSLSRTLTIIWDDSRNCIHFIIAEEISFQRCTNELLVNL